jgi:hypothetical protein
MASKPQPFKRDFRGAPVETKTFQGDGEDSVGSNPAKDELDQIANRWQVGIQKLAKVDAKSILEFTLHTIHFSLPETQISL